MLSGETLSTYTGLYVRRSQIDPGVWVVIGINRSGFHSVIYLCSSRWWAERRRVEMMERRYRYIQKFRKVQKGCNRSQDESSR